MCVTKVDEGGYTMLHSITHLGNIVLGVLLHAGTADFPVPSTNTGKKKKNCLFHFADILLIHHILWGCAS